MRIFVSYAAEQKDIAEPIALALRDRGFDVFFDRDDLPAGASYDLRIEQAIGASDLLVFLISPMSVTRGRYTLTELEFARKKWRKADGRVLPVLAVETDLATIPSFLKSVNILQPAGNAAAEVGATVAAMVRPPAVGRIVPAAVAIGVASGLLGTFVALPIEDIPANPDKGQLLLHVTGDAPLSTPLFYSIGLGLLFVLFSRPPLMRLVFPTVGIFIGWLVAINVYFKMVGIQTGDAPDREKIETIVWFATGAASGALGAFFTWLGAAICLPQLFRLDRMLSLTLVGAIAGFLVYPTYNPPFEFMGNHASWLLFCGWQAAVTAVIAWLLAQEPSR